MSTLARSVPSCAESPVHVYALTSTVTQPVSACTLVAPPAVTATGPTGCPSL
ncbi:hypothetical protein D3C83_195310 [compost metagenome]